MLGFERRVVGALVDDVDPASRAQIERWVEVSLDDLPDVVRLGVRAQSVVLGLWYRTRPDQVLVERLQDSPLWPVRGYLRALRSLVLMARHELVDAPAAA